METFRGRPTSRALRVELGRRLAKLRLSRNVTQQMLAEDAGIAVRTLRNIEAGRPSSLDSLLRLASALDLADALLRAVPSHEIRPIERVDRGGRARRRARPRKSDRSEPWTWGEDSTD